MFARLRKVSTIIRHPFALRALLRDRVAMATEHLGAIALVSPATLLDAGANKGQFSLAVRTLFPSVEIHAFEPLPQAQIRFLRIFRGDVRTTLHPVALSAEDGMATLYVADRADSSSLLALTEAQNAAYGVAQVGSVDVYKRRLEHEVDLTSLARPVLLKIDVQGGELDVLKGVADFSTIDFVYVELSFVELYAGQPLFDEVVNFLRSKGFRLRGVFNASSTRAFGPTQVDALLERE